MSSAAVIRAAEPGDLPALLQLEALFPSDRMSRRSLQHFIKAPNAIFLVAEHEQIVRGNLLLLSRRDSARARIYSVVVDPATRSLGLARALVTSAEARAHQRGLLSVSLEVRADNTAARALYSALGYAQAAALPSYYDDGADGLRLIKPLP